MFTGIITDIGQVLLITKDGDMRARIATRYDLSKVEIGASIASDGVCLTVVSLNPSDKDNWYEVQISAETLDKTNLGRWKKGTHINLERSLKIGDELGGHIVSGHVDGVICVVSTRSEEGSLRVTFNAPKHLAKFIVQKGSVALNGTSLTVNEVSGCEFGVNLIPHTQQVTTWSSVQAGDLVNLEVDLMARYVARLREYDETR